jgi:hypothetical protein
VLAYFVPDRGALDAIRDAQAVPLRVVRLSVPITEIERRLSADVTSGRKDDLRDAAESIAASAGAGVEDLLLERRLTESMWTEHGLVFATQLGGPLDVGNIRRAFRAICRAVGIGENWSPRELRTSFVSLMSHRGVSTEEIAQLVGHPSTRTTEVIYRKELRPVINTGATIMDRLFGSPGLAWPRSGAGRA